MSDIPYSDDGWPYMVCDVHNIVWDANLTNSDRCPDGKPDEECDIREAEPEEVARP